MSRFSPACARFGKALLPSVGFVLVGMESALQRQPRSAGGINVLMGSDVHRTTRRSSYPHCLGPQMM